MKLVNTRNIFTENSTIGELTIDGDFFCFILEPADLGLTYDMEEIYIAKIKVDGHTAIPTGIYKLILAEAPHLITRFPKLIAASKGTIFKFPELQNVKGFGGIFIHPGNYPKNTEGCNLPGLSKNIDFVGSSIEAFELLKAKIYAAIEVGEASYEICRNSGTWESFKNIRSR